MTHGSVGTEPVPERDGFVGRQSALESLLDFGRDARQGRGTCVLVRGPAGIGKTRLLAEARGALVVQGFTVATSACWPRGEAPPLWPWTDLLAQLAGPDVGVVSPPGADRFAYLESVAAEVRAHARRNPLALFLDDVHHADEGTRLAINFMSRRVVELPVLVLAARRTEPGELADDELEQHARVVTLTGLGPEEVLRLAEVLGHPVDPAVAGTLTEMTGGNPLAVRTVLADTQDPGGSDAPVALRAVADARLRALDPTVVDIVRRAAVLGTVIDPEGLAAVSEVPIDQVRRALRMARAAGVLGVDPHGRPAFVHDEMHEALVEGLAVAERWAVHARAVAVIDASDPTPAGRRRAAGHALRAAPASAAARHAALGRAEAVAADLVTGHGFHDADELLTDATDVARRTGDGRIPAGLLRAQAYAVMLAGRVAEAHVRFVEAVAAARAEGDPVLIADAASGLGGLWVNNVRDAVEQHRLLRWGRAAHAALPPGHEGIDLRLRSRIAVGSVFLEGADLDEVWNVLEQARTCPDPVVRLEVASNVHTALLGPQWATVRLQLAEEMARDAGEVGAGVYPLMARCWRMVDLFLVGDPRAGRALAELRAPAEAMQCLSVLYIVRAVEVMLLIRAGRFDEAEDAAAEAFALGEQAQDVDALAYYGAHLVTVRWFQGRDDDLLDLAQQVAEYPGRGDIDGSFDAAAAALAARAGRLDVADRHLRRVTAGGLERWPRFGTWMATMAGAIEAAAVLGDTDTVRRAAELLTPYADLPVAPSMAVTCLGSAHRFLGMAANALGDLDGAVEHLDAAVKANVDLHHRPAAAMARAELALTLMHRGGISDQAQATQLLERASVDAEAMGMGSLVQRWHAQVPAPRPEAVAEPMPARLAIEQRDPGSWEVVFGPDRTVVADRAGLRYLARLVREAGRPLSALELAAGGAGGLRVAVRGDRVLDQVARRTLEDRARELATRVAEARRSGREQDQRRFEDELDAIADELRRTSGAGGRVRKFADESERARTAVRKAILRAIGEIERALPGAGTHLRLTVVTGTECTYRPELARADRVVSSRLPSSHAASM